MIRNIFLVATVGVVSCVSANAQATTLDVFSEIKNRAGFVCGNGEKLCTDMLGCKEAVYHRTCCGEVDRDGDHNGVPCENVCGQENAESISYVETLRVELGCPKP